mgnify:CR=1 FL=1
MFLFFFLMPFPEFINMCLNIFLNLSNLGEFLSFPLQVLMPLIMSLLESYKFEPLLIDFIASQGKLVRRADLHYYASMPLASGEPAFTMPTAFLFNLEHAFFASTVVQRLQRKLEWSVWDRALGDATTARRCRRLSKHIWLKGRRLARRRRGAP